jgi:hypothetical protein
VKARAIRLSVIYLALLAALAGARYQNRDTYPTLRDLSEQESALLFRLNSLRLDVARLESPARVKDWAAKNGFIAFSSAKHEFAPLQAAKEPKPDIPPFTGLEVSTKWR